MICNKRPFPAGVLLLPVVMTILLCPCPPADAGDKDVVATVNGAQITAAQVEREIERLIPQTTYHRKVTEERKEQLAGEALENLITRELLFQEATARGITPGGRAVRKQLSGIRDRYRTKKEYQSALERSGMTEEELRSELEQATAVQELMQKAVVLPSAMDDAALRSYYAGNTGKFRRPESVRVRVISTHDRALADSVLAKIAKGAPFESMAEQYSEDMHRVKGGDMGFIHKGQFSVPELDDAAFALSAGSVSALITVKDAFYILKVEEKRPEAVLPFEEIRSGLKQELEKKKQEELKKELLDGLSARARIERRADKK